MASVQPLTCCGWAEIDGVQHYRSINFHHFLGVAKTYSKGAFLFSSACRSEKPRSCGASRFARDITKNKLGTITQLPAFKNPNSGRIIIPFLWHVNKTALDRYCSEHKIRPSYWY